jgi:hypothetical protein
MPGFCILTPAAGVLWSVAPRLVFFLLGYAIFGTWLTAAGFGRRLMRLHYAILKREGDLRFDLVRVRENAGKQASEECAGGVVVSHSSVQAAANQSCPQQRGRLVQLFCA